MEVGEERTDSSDFDFCFMRKSYFSEMVFRPSSNAEHMADWSTWQVVTSLSMYLLSTRCQSKQKCRSTECHYKCI